MERLEGETLAQRLSRRAAARAGAQGPGADQSNTTLVVVDVTRSDRGLVPGRNESGARLKQARITPPQSK
jgi:hypothetical protein